MIRRLLAQMSLRVRLVTAVVLLVAAALTVISTAGVVVLRGQLLARIDTQLSLVDDSNPPMPAAGPQKRPGHGDPGGGTSFFRIQEYNADGKAVEDGAPAADGKPGLGGPVVPEDAAWLDEHAGQPVTVPARSEGDSWRVLVRSQADTSGWVVVAMPLGELNNTISELVTADLTVGVLGLLIVAIVSVVLVRATLRPLVKVEQTAAAIAAGDLSQRVLEHPPQTELGRLGRALNSMLTQIEEAFEARTRSESTARRSEERMRRFVSDAGHDLRTPLAVIRAWAEYAHHGPRRDRADLERTLTIVGTEATRMSTLVEDLLLLARLDQQRPLERHPVDVLAVAVDAVRDARLLAPARDIELTVDDRADYVVTGDELRLRQVLSNLASNALTHTPPDTPVSIMLGPGRLGEAPALLLDVADRGPGLAPEQAERVFERFYRTDTSRTRRTGGSGLGLAIVASLVAAHKGTVSVHSSPGAGATFRITLPLADTGTPSNQPGETPDDSSKLHAGHDDRALHT